MTTQPNEPSGWQGDVTPPEEPKEEKFGDVLDEEPFTIKKGVEEIGKAGERLQKSGWKPWRDMVGSYVGRFVDAVNGLADGFEGKKKKDD